MTRGAPKGVRGRHTIALAIAALFALWSGPDANAAGFASARFGGEHGNVTAHNPTALYYNPAGIGFSGGVHVFVDGTLALRSVTWEHALSPLDPPEPADAQGSNAGTAELLNVFGAPMLGASVRIGDLALGAAVYVPFGGRASWSENPEFAAHPVYPGAAAGVQRWHSIRGALTYLYGSFGAAYRLGRLSVGASANLIRSSIVSRRARNLSSPDPALSGLPQTDREARADIDVSGVHGSFALGALFEAIEAQLWLGASYQAQPALGPMQLSGDLTFTDTDGVRGTVNVTLDQALPDIVRFGARYRATPEWELRAFGDVTRWSVLQTQCVAQQGRACRVTATGAPSDAGGVYLNFRRYWRDTVGLRVGASHWTQPEVELFLGAGFETAATPDETLDPELPDSETVAAALGARWELFPQLFVAASYTHLHYFARDTTGKNRLPLAEPPTRRPDGGGRYSQWIGVLNANLEKQF